MASPQSLSPTTAYTAPLVFTDGNGVTGKGPVGTVASSDPSIAPTLSADGQSCNLMTPTSLVAPATLTWHDPSNTVPDFTVVINVAVVVPPFQPVAGAFGTFVSGTTP